MTTQSCRPPSATSSRASLAHSIRLRRPPAAFDAGEFSLPPRGPESRPVASKARTAAGGSRPARRSERLTLVSHSDPFEAPSTGGEGANHLRYFFDAVGNITEVHDRADAQEASRNLLFSGVDPVSGYGRYEYDALYRLTKAEGREHPGQQPTAAEPIRGSVPHANDLSALERYTEEFVYDEAGNIREVVHTSTSTSWTRLYEYATTSNRLLKTYGPSDVPGTIPAIPYDAHGSMTRLAEMQTMSWDYADRFVSADLGGGGDVFFTYDASGERVRKVREHDGGGRFEERIYLGGFEIYRRWDGPIGDPATTLEVERETLHVLDDQKRIAMVETKNVDPGSEDVGVLDTPRWRFQLGNHLDSAAMELDEASGILSYEEYHPYGSTAFHTARGGAEVSAKRYRYTGKEKDEETGLYYHGARYYAAWLGRWTAADPAGLVDGLNLYRYSRDNPINFSDPGGTQAESARRDLGRHEFTGNETREELDALAWAQGYEIVGTPTWDAEKKGWNLGQIRRIADVDLGGDQQWTPMNESEDESGAGDESAGVDSEPDDSPGAAPPVEGAAGSVESSGEGSTTDAAVGFAAGFAKGAAKSIAIGVGLSLLGGTAAAVLGAGLLGVAAYGLATGGAKNIFDTGSRIISGSGSSADFEAAGELLGGLVGGRIRGPKSAPKGGSTGGGKGSGGSGSGGGGKGPSGGGGTSGGKGQLVGVLRARALRLAGFSDEGAPIILDENLAARGVAEALRAEGFNVRSVAEIFGRNGVKDAEIRKFAEAIGARVLTMDRGRQLGEGFGQLAIHVSARVGPHVDSLVRILRNFR